MSLQPSVMTDAVACRGVMRALSVRPLWAWLIVHGLKDIENRNWRTSVRGRVLIHASKGMTRTEYDAARWFAEDILGDAVALPAYGALDRGGIIGSVEIVDCVDSSDSRWFMGRHGFVLRRAEPTPFVPLLGRLGFFSVPAFGDV